MFFRKKKQADTEETPLKRDVYYYDKIKNRVMCDYIRYYKYEKSQFRDTLLLDAFLFNNDHLRLGWLPNEKRYFVLDCKLTNNIYLPDYRTFFYQTPEEAYEHKDEEMSMAVIQDLLLK